MAMQEFYLCLHVIPDFLCLSVQRLGTAVPAGGGEALPLSSHLQSEPQHPGGSRRGAAEPRCGSLGCESMGKVLVLFTL